MGIALHRVKVKREFGINRVVYCFRILFPYIVPL
jgi:hypothetical protein